MTTPLDCVGDTVRLALKAMGYTPSAKFPKRWAKPVGFSLFTFNEEGNEWGNWFVDATGTTRLWTAKTLDTSGRKGFPYVGQLGEFEAYTRINLVGREVIHLSVVDVGV
jgi:hypothetical protein